MNTLVVDASIAVKWVLEEDSTAEAWRSVKAKLIAPELLVAECACQSAFKIARRMWLNARCYAPASGLR